MPIMLLVSYTIAMMMMMWFGAYVIGSISRMGIWVSVSGKLNTWFGLVSATRLGPFRQSYLAHPISHYGKDAGLCFI